MGYIVKTEDSQTGEVTRRDSFVIEQEARMVLANAVEQAYDFNPLENMRIAICNFVVMFATFGALATDDCGKDGVGTWLKPGDVAKIGMSLKVIDWNARR